MTWYPMSLPAEEYSPQITSVKSLFARSLEGAGLMLLISSGELVAKIESMAAVIAKDLIPICIVAVVNVERVRVSGQKVVSTCIGLEENDRWDALPATNELVL